MVWAIWRLKIFWLTYLEQKDFGRTFFRVDKKHTYLRVLNFVSTIVSVSFRNLIQLTPLPIGYFWVQYLRGLFWGYKNLASIASPYH